MEKAMNIRKGYKLTFMGQTKTVKKINNIKKECWFDDNTWISMDYLRHAQRIGTLRIEK
jgi:hypothetical protein